MMKYYHSTEVTSILNLSGTGYFLILGGKEHVINLNFTRKCRKALQNHDIIGTVSAKGKDERMIKLVAVDMDGTLLNTQGRVSDRNADAIRQLQERGIEVVVCTGRSYEDAAAPVREQGLRCDVICMNGSAVFDKDGRQIQKSPLTRSQMEDILNCCKDDKVIFDFMTNQGSYTIATEEEFKMCFESDILLPASVKHEYEQIRSRFHLTTREDLLSMGLEFYKVSVIHGNPFILEKIRGALKRCHGLAAASSYHTNIEITSRTAQKGIALTEYALERGIGYREMMAIGDSENDYSMLSLQLAYTVAMENAMESIKKIAKCQTRSNVEDGVAYAIETLILSEEACAC